MENRRCKYQGEPSDPDCMECDGNLSCCKPVNNTLQFFCPMIPPTSTAQMHAVSVVNGKPHFFDPFEVKQARAKLLSAVCRHAPEQPFKGALRLTTKWCFPIKGRHTDGEYRTSRPDVTNLQKLFEDVMTQCGFWKDDAQIASAITEKFWSDIPGIFVRIDMIGE